MSVITAPPILIDSINFCTGPAYELTPVLVPRGSNLYQILIAYDDITGFGTLHAFKSTNGGSTWVEQDLAHTPDAANQSGYYYTFNDPSRNAIDVLYRTGTFGSPSNSIIICTFSTATDTWGAPGVAFDVSVIPDHANLIRYCIYKKPAGNWVVIGSSLSFGPSVFRLYYLTFDGAVWAGPTNLTTTNNDGDDVWGGRLNANGNFYFLATGGASDHELYLYQLSPTFVLSAKITLGTNVFFNSAFSSADMSMTFWGTNSIAVGFISTGGTVEMRVGTPLTAPVFTSYVISSSTGSQIFYYARPIVDGNGNLNVFWIIRDSIIIAPNILNQVWQSTFDGISTWTPPILFYDALVDPPSGVFVGFTVSLLHKFDALQLTPGSWIVFTTMGGISAEHENIAFILLSGTTPPSGPSLQLKKTVSGGSAGPSAFTLRAVGPTIVTGTGDTGLTLVTPGLYVLSETGPPGYLQGTWNCNATMPTPNSVLVGGTGTTSPVQVASDKSFGPSITGIGPTQFAIGSNLYRVLWSPFFKRLAIFKRATASVGGAWTEMNPLGSPDQGNQSGYWKVSVSGTVITIAYVTTNLISVKLCSFNTGTDTYGVVSGTLTVESSLTTFAFGQAAGVFILVGGGINHIYYATNTAGVWNGPNNLQLNKTIVFDGWVDSTGATHIIDQIVGPGAEYRRLSAAFALGAPTGLANVIALNPGGYPTITPWGAASFAIGVVDQFGANAGKAQVWIGTPLAVPVLNQYIVYTPTLTHEVVTFVRPAQDLANILSCFFVDIDYDTPTDQLRQSIFNGATFAATTLFYDVIASPPPSGVTPVTAQAIQAPDMLNLAAGWVGGVGLNTTGGSLTGEFIEASTTNTTVLCTINNTFTGFNPVPGSVTEYPIKCPCG